MQDFASDPTSPPLIPAAPWRVKALSVLPDYRLAVTFQDGTNGIVDFSAVLTAKDCGIFDALKDKAIFNQARLDLGVVVWPNGWQIWIPAGCMSRSGRTNRGLSPFDFARTQAFELCSKRSPDGMQWNPG